MVITKKGAFTGSLRLPLLATGTGISEVGLKKLPLLPCGERLFSRENPRMKLKGSCIVRIGRAAPWSSSSSAAAASRAPISLLSLMSIVLRFRPNVGRSNSRKIQFVGFGRGDDSLIPPRAHSAISKCCWRLLTMSHCARSHSCGADVPGLQLATWWRQRDSRHMPRP